MKKRLWVFGFLFLLLAGVLLLAPKGVEAAALSSPDYSITRSGNSNSNNIYHANTPNTLGLNANLQLKRAGCTVVVTAGSEAGYVLYNSRFQIEITGSGTNKNIECWEYYARPTIEHAFSFADGEPVTYIVTLTWSTMKFYVNGDLYGTVAFSSAPWT